MDVGFWRYMTNTNIKKQSRKVGVSGGFINQMMGNNSSIPIVGEGATILMYSDREAYQVIEVSDDGLSCVIQQMNTKHLGKSYGDERYEYSDNPKGYTMNIEWNARKSCWGEVTYSVDIIKSLAKKYYKEYGYGWTNILLAEHSLTYDDIIDGEKMGMLTKHKLIEGLTKKYKNFNKISVIFGVMDKYRNPHF